MWSRVGWLLMGLCLPAWAGAAQGVLWQVTRPGLVPSYLFATVHLEDPRILDLPSAVRTALARARSLTLEVDLEPANIDSLRRAMYFRDGRSLATVLGPQLFSRVLPLLARYGVNEAQAQAMKPWAVLTTLSMPPPRTGLFLDYALYQSARRAGKPVYGLEGMDEQIAYFNTMPLTDQRALVRDAVQQYAALDDMLAQMRQAYLARDLDALAAINRRFQRGSDPALMQRFMTRFITERNRLMAERMQPHLREGGAFVAVGALHLPGPQGLIALLRARGYRLEVIY